MKRVLVCLFALCCLLVPKSGAVAFEASPAAVKNSAVAKASEDRAAFAALLSETLRPPEKKRKKTNERERALAHTAGVYGFQKGFQWKYRKYLEAIEARGPEFEKIFDFRRLLIDNRVLPPVIRWSGFATTLESDTIASQCSAEYRIVSPARIVTTPPGYREYFLCDTDVVPFDAVFLPENDGERALWKDALSKGWKEGMEQATIIFDTNMQRLVSDYRGILRFAILHKEGLVSLPVLASGELGNEVSDNVLTMDQKVFRITLPARFRKILK